MSINFWKKEDAGAAAALPYEEPVAGDLARASSIARAEEGIVTHIVRWAVSIGIFLVPIFFLPYSSNVLELNKQILLAAVAAVGLIAWLLGVVTSGRMSFRNTLLDRGVLAFLIGTLVTTILSITPMHSVFGVAVSLNDSLVTVFSLTVLYFLAVNAFDDHGRQIRMMLMGGTLVALAYGLLQMLSLYILPGGFTHSRAFNTVGLINSLGFLAAVMLPFFVKFKLSLGKYFDIAKLGALIALVILAIINWWVLWTVVIAGMLATIAFDSIGMAQGRRSGSSFRIARLLLPMTIIILAVFLMMVKFNVAPVKKNLPVEISPSYSLSNRVVGGVMKENLLFGYGPENFSVAFDTYGASQLVNTTLSGFKFYDAVSHVENIVIQGGVFLSVAFLLLLGTIFTALWKSRLILSYAGADAVSGTMAGVVAITVGLFLYPLNVTSALVFYVMLASAALLVWSDTKRTVNIEEKVGFSLASSLGFIVGLITILTGGYFLTLQYVGDVRYAQALGTSNLDKAAQFLTDSVNWNGKDDRAYRALSQVALQNLEKELDKRDAKDGQQTTRIQNDIKSAIDLARRATQANPREADNWANLGNMYGNLLGIVDGVDTLSENAYTQAATLRPGDASFYNNIGSMYLSESDLMRQVARNAGANAAQLNQSAEVALIKAESAFKKAVDISQSFGLAIYNLGAVYDRQNKVTEAIKQIEKIIPYNSDNANLLFELGLLYYRAQRKEDAFQALQRSVLVSKNNFANARWYLALIYEERKDLANATAELNKILETNPDNETVLAELAKLGQGKPTVPPAKVIDQKPL